MNEYEARKDVGRKITYFLFRWRLNKTVQTWGKGTDFPGEIHWTAISPIQVIVLRTIFLLPALPIMSLFFCVVLAFTGDVKRAKRAAFEF